MITTDVIQGAFQGIVESLKTRVRFYSVWGQVKDEPGEPRYAVCWWRATDTTVSVDDSYSLRDGFRIDCMFLEQTAVDRSSEERDQAYSRMNAIARIVWAKFFQTYIQNTATFQGVELDLSPKLTSEAKFHRVWDMGPKMMTGVLLTVTVVSGGPNVCLDTYFNGS